MNTAMQDELQAKGSQSMVKDFLGKIIQAVSVLRYAELRTYFRAKTFQQTSLHKY